MNQLTITRINSLTDGDYFEYCRTGNKYRYAGKNDDGLMTGVDIKTLETRYFGGASKVVRIDKNLIKLFA